MTLHAVKDGALVDARDMRVKQHGLWFRPRELRVKRNGQWETGYQTRVTKPLVVQVVGEGTTQEEANSAARLQAELLWQVERGQQEGYISHTGPSIEVTELDPLIGSRHEMVSAVRTAKSTTTEAAARTAAQTDALEAARALIPAGGTFIGVTYGDESVNTSSGPSSVVITFNGVLTTRVTINCPPSAAHQDTVSATRSATAASEAAARASARAAALAAARASIPDGGTYASVAYGSESTTTQTGVTQIITGYTYPWSISWRYDCGEDSTDSSSGTLSGAGTGETPREAEISAATQRATAVSGLFNNKPAGCGLAYIPSTGPATPITQNVPGGTTYTVTTTATVTYNILSYSQTLSTEASGATEEEVTATLNSALPELLAPLQAEVDMGCTFTYREPRISIRPSYELVRGTTYQLTTTATVTYSIAVPTYQARATARGTVTYEPAT